MSFREKSALLTIVTMIVAFGIYGWRVVQGPVGPVEQFGLLVGVVVAQVVLIAGGHILLAIASRRMPEPRDERDRMVELRSAHNGYFVMITGLFAMMAVVFFGASAVNVINGLLGVVVLAEIVRFGSQLVYWRRGS